MATKNKDQELLSKCDPHLMAIRMVVTVLRTAPDPLGRVGQELGTARDCLFKAVLSGDRTTARNWVNAVDAAASCLPDDHPSAAPLDDAVEGLKKILSRNNTGAKE